MSSLIHAGTTYDKIIGVTPAQFRALVAVFVALEYGGDRKCARGRRTFHTYPWNITASSIAASALVAKGLVTERVAIYGKSVQIELDPTDLAVTAFAHDGGLRGAVKETVLEMRRNVATSEKNDRLRRRSQYNGRETEDLSGLFKGRSQ